MRKRFSLNGLWDFSVAGGRKEKVRVPSSYFCVGEALLSRRIALPEAQNKRLFLVFEGIAYEGDVYVDGSHLGSMLPYVQYEFEVTRFAGREVEITAKIRDITAKYGPTGGWEDYGGIIRDCYLELRPEKYIDSVQWIANVSPDLTRAEGSLTVLDADGSALSFSASLAYKGDVFWKIEGNGKTMLSLKDFLLWSPENPVLYRLIISTEADEWEEDIGFRRFEINGPHFLLNGKKIFLKGVARHEMWGENQGFTLTEEQIERDFHLMKQCGVNYCRLVHYPHSRKEIEIANRTGIMVSEEPGLWWSDLSDTYTTTCAKEIMRRTVIRDRNSPSVIFWLLFNECVFKGDYLIEGKTICNTFDPTRLVSAANCMKMESTKEEFDRTGMDFYTIHPYGFFPEKPDCGDSFWSILELLKDRPTVFTEWGGWYIKNNSNLIANFKRALHILANNKAPEPVLAGMAWWQWQNMYQLYRGLPACETGVLSDGLVDQNRNRLPMYEQMMGFFDAIDEKSPEKHELWVDSTLGIEYDNRVYQPICLRDAREGAGQKEAWNRVIHNPNRTIKSHCKNPIPDRGAVCPETILQIGAIPVDIPEGPPIVLCKDLQSVSIKVNMKAKRLHFFGHTSYCEGYPIHGVFDRPLAYYRLCYSDGNKTEIQLRNGIDFASSSMIALGSRLNPMAAHTRRIAKMVLEPDWEHYQILYAAFESDPSRTLDSITFGLTDMEETALLYGITVEV
ncbi:hypothetical protein AGMMS49928_02540 [Spirochaetia bacterium]|nr:hypothetical protein AGMMS49928_02540 [Spirochaetia bacterium]